MSYILRIHLFFTHMLRRAGSLVIHKILADFAINFNNTFDLLNNCIFCQMKRGYETVSYRPD